jgi:hypothetical protein
MFMDGQSEQEYILFPSYHCFHIKIGVFVLFLHTMLHGLPATATIT